MTYIGNSLFILYIPIYYLGVLIGWNDYQPNIFPNNFYQLANDTQELIANESIDYSEGSNSAEMQPMSITMVDDEVEEDQKEIIPTYTHYDCFKVALCISPIWFLSNCCYNYSLLMTSVSSSTIISNLSGTFTLAFAYIYSLEKVTFGKIIGIILCFFGATIITFEDDTNNNNRSVTGDFIALLASLGYGIYTTMIRFMIPNENKISMQLVLGYIGLVNLVMAAPILLVEYDKIYKLSLEIIGFLVVNGIFDNVISDYLWARAVILTSPTVATLGTSITIPLGMLSDYFLAKDTFTLLSIIGAVSVVIGFVFVNTKSFKCDNRS